MNGLGEEDHQAFYDYLSEIHPKELQALRHLLACPLCQEMARLLLTPAWPPEPPERNVPRRTRPGRRPRRPRHEEPS